MPDVSSLCSLVEEFVEELLADFQSPNIRGKKAIHDSLFGTNMFMQHEVAIIDTPFIQRLRRIAQTGLAYNTYPSATHTRFGHTLGVAMLAEKMARKINDAVPERIIDCDPTKGDLAELRMAALLHDCGHGFFSHLSEQIYGQQFRSDMDAVRKTHGQLGSCKEHEIVSYLIVKSKRFAQFFEDHINGPYKLNLDLANIANYIIGYAKSERQYLAQIINGPFDVDKLDYIARDSLFTGLQLNIDVERLFYTISIANYRNQRNLVIDFYGARAVEQLLFSKMLLFSSVYHHQKVRACDCVIKGLVEFIIDKGIAVDGKPLTNPLNFVRLTDYDLFNKIGVGRDYVKKIIESINNRVVLKRSLTLCKEAIDNYDDGILDVLLRLNDHPDEMRKLRRRIALRVGGDDTLTYSIWIDLPKRPELKEATSTLVRSPNGDVNTLDPHYFPVKGWCRRPDYLS